MKPKNKYEWILKKYNKERKSLRLLIIGDDSAFDLSARSLPSTNNNNKNIILIVKQ